MEKIEVTWGNTLRVWWSFMWRVGLFSGIAGGVLGFIGGIVVGVMGKSELAAPVGAVLGWLGTFPVSIWVLKIILNKQYKTFSVALINEPNNVGSPG